MGNLPIRKRMPRHRGKIMSTPKLLFFGFLSVIFTHAAAAQENQTGLRHITLDEAVQLALKHNHVIRIAAYKVEEKEHARDVARSAYFPLLRNDTGALRVTDTQFIGIPAGALGIAGGAVVPSRSVILNQGGQTFVTSGTSLTQPLMQLLKVKSVNDIAREDLNATRNTERQTENTVALGVHQIYYRVLIAQPHRAAVVAKIQASEDLNRELVEQ